MKDEKETTTLRVPVNILRDIKNEASQAGLSANSYMLLAIHLGRKALSSDLNLLVDTRE